jgi:aspartyl-tRNA(Asn)/glutamyl-tRNA(Gln) amidotransferase subunit C
MVVSRQDVLQIAHLARLRLSAEEVDRFAEQLSGILAHVAELNALDVEGIGAVGGAAEGAAPLRGDESAPDALRLPLAAMAPAWEDGFFTVPRVAALDTSELEEPFEDKARAASAGRPDEADVAGGEA